nr:2-dehydropantoate 2-reductase [Maliibacterium massiliense]
MEKPSIAVIGAGAIGGITAAFMAQAGCDVELVCKHEAIAAQACGEGLHVVGVRGEHTIAVPAVARIDALHGKKDLVLIATKAYDMPEAARQALPFLREDALVVSLQNGICTDALAEIVDGTRAVGCVIGWGATMLEAGKLDMTSTGEFIIGMPDGTADKRLEALKDAMAHVAPTLISQDIMSELYSKLIVNACITSLGAICGLYLGQMMKIARARNIFLAIIREAMDVARAMRLQVKPFGGKLDYDKLMAGTGALDNLRRHIMIRIVGMKFKRLKSSSLQSLERGRPTEIDYFNGYIAKKGAQLGVNTPINSRMVSMVREIEQGRRRIDVANLEDPAFDQA